MSKKKTKRSVSPNRKKATKSLTRKQILDAEEAHSQRVTTRLARRDSDTSRIDISIPADVLAFLHSLYESPPLELPDGKDFWMDGRRIAAIVSALREAYSQGCVQGYIEGFVARREPDRQRSRKANDAKARKLVDVDSGKMTRADRNAAIVDEYPQLLRVMNPTPAKERLAGKYGFESWQGVDAVIKAFAARDTQ